MADKGDIPITWEQFRNAIPMLGVLVAIVLSYAVLKSDILLGKQRQDTTDTNVVEMKQDLKDIKNSTNTMAKDIVQLKTLLQIQASAKGYTNTPTVIAYAVSPTPSPTVITPSPVPNVQQSQSVIVQPQPTAALSPPPAPPAPTASPTPPASVSPIDSIKKAIPTILGIPIVVGLVVMKRFMA